MIYKLYISTQRPNTISLIVLDRESCKEVVNTNFNSVKYDFSATIAQASEYAYSLVEYFDIPLHHINGFGHSGVSMCQQLQGARCALSHSELIRELEEC